MKRLLIYALAIFCTGTLSAQVTGFPYCQIADRQDEPAWWFAADYIVPAEVANNKEVSIFEINGTVGLVYLPTDVGNIDIRLRTHLSLFGGSGGIDLPDFVGKISADVSWTIRQSNGTSIQLGIEPGIYSDFKDINGKDFYVPLHLAFIYPFTEFFSGMAGANIYPGFDHFIDPILGVRLMVSDVLLIDLFYPESRITLMPEDEWRLYIGYQTKKFPEYQLEETDTRDRLLVDEDRLFVGWNFHMFYDAQLMVEGGMTMNRSFDFEDRGRKASIDDALYLQVGIGALF